MKTKLFLLLAIAFSVAGTAQCIKGLTTFTVSQTYMFSSDPLAQCTGCYDWDINGSSSSSDNAVVGNLQIIGSDTGRDVYIKVLSAGAFTISLTYFDETGCHSCSQSYNNLPTVNCFGFDPVQPIDIDASGKLNYGYLGNPYSAPIPDAGLTFDWYFKFQDGHIEHYNGQNPQFRELCPDNPVKSFAVLVSNGVQSRSYKSIVPGYAIPGFSGANSPTCFIHEQCGWEEFKAKTNSIIVSPNPTKSVIHFEGTDLEKHNISLFDNQGNKVLDNIKLEKSINLSSQKEGLYIYIITNENGYVQEGKIVKN